jgi:RND family efflux transporter MFP subunit
MWLLNMCVLAAGVLSGCGPAQTQPDPVRAVRTLRIEGQGSTVEREFAGEIRARLESRLSFRVPGKMVTRPANLGDSVKSGQVLAQLDAADLALGQQAARAALVAAQAQATQAAADFKRFQDLKAQGFISPAQLERYQTALKSADAALAQTRANASLQGNQTSYSQILADGSGVITAIDAEAGQVMAVGEPVLTLAHDGPRDVVFAVPEDMGMVLRHMVGQSGLLKVRLWGAGQWLSATVREVAAATDGVTRTLQVKADLVGGQLGGVNLGQTATVAMSVPSRAGQGLLLPLQALVEHQGQSNVWVLNPQTMTVKRQPVITAEVSGNLVLVARGLQAGQEVVTAGVHVLTPGQKVKRLSVSQAAAAQH